MFGQVGMNLTGRMPHEHNLPFRVHKRWHHLIPLMQGMLCRAQKLRVGPILARFCPLPAALQKKTSASPPPVICTEDSYTPHSQQSSNDNQACPTALGWLSDSSLGSVQRDGKACSAGGDDNGIIDTNCQVTVPPRQGVIGHADSEHAPGYISQDVSENDDIPSAQQEGSLPVSSGQPPATNSEDVSIKDLIGSYSTQQQVRCFASFEG